MSKQSEPGQGEGVLEWEPGKGIVTQTDGEVIAPRIIEVGRAQVNAHALDVNAI